MENERKKKFQDYAPPEQKPSGGYNLNGVYYSRDGQRLDDQPKKSWSQREYERAEREKIHCHNNLSSTNCLSDIGKGAGTYYRYQP